MPLARCYKDQDKYPLLLFCQCSSTQAEEGHRCWMSERKHLSWLHCTQKHIFPHQDPQVREGEGTPDSNRACLLSSAHHALHAHSPYPN